MALSRLPRGGKLTNRPRSEESFGQGHLKEEVRVAALSAMRITGWKKFGSGKFGMWG